METVALSFQLSAISNQVDLARSLIAERLTADGFILTYDS